MAYCSTIDDEDNIWFKGGSLFLYMLVFNNFGSQYKIYRVGIQQIDAFSINWMQLIPSKKYALGVKIQERQIYQTLRNIFFQNFLIIKPNFDPPCYDIAKTWNFILTEFAQF